MITEKKYNDIIIKYGQVASWAIWTTIDKKPKSNVGDMSIFDLKKNRNLFAILNTNVVMVGLNFSRQVKFDLPFRNFHDLNPRGQFYKIRFAFEETKFWGAYMTDLIKNNPMLSSKDVMKLLKENKDLLMENINSFCEELNFVCENPPIIISFGNDVYNLLINNLDRKFHHQLIKITHYSHQIGQEEYRKDVLHQIEYQTGEILDLNIIFDDINNKAEKLLKYIQLNNDKLNSLNILEFQNLKKTIQNIYNEINKYA